MKLSLLFAMTIVCAHDASAQSSTDASQLLRAAAHYVTSTLLPNKSLALDTTRYRARTPNMIAQTTATDLVTAHELGTVRVGTRRDFIKCPSGPTSCVFDGIDAVVSLGPMAIHGDTGIVRIGIVQHISSSKQPVLRTGGAARFIRRTQGWSFLSYARASTS